MRFARFGFMFAFALAVAGGLNAASPQSVSAASVCYWSGLLNDSKTVSYAPVWTMKAWWKYGYNCYGQIVKMRVDTVYVKIDFTNNGNYLDGIEHRMTFAGVFAWNPLETYNPPVWQNTYVHKCSGGCVLYYQWSPAAGNADIDLSNYNAFGGPGHGFKDAMFFVDCESCGEIGGVIFEEGRYNFPRDVMTVNGEFASGGEGHYPYP